MKRHGTACGRFPIAAIIPIITVALGLSCKTQTEQLAEPADAASFV